ncbi:MAG TPA: TraR/DksA C4-type zinc finger protein [Gemmataceae bacterium]|nr:TraR/DksA C4-type zinc finger protein [Gemmataceae bacterium]
MTRTQIDAYRAKLLALHTRIRGDMSEMEGEAFRKTGGEASGSLSSVPIHLADLGTDNFEEELTLDLLENQDQILEEIGAALGRLDDGSFGRCEECGRAIGRERLDALPYTRLCVDCARQSERRASR